MTVKLLTSIAGDVTASVGETVTLDKDFEKRLVDSGQAEYVKKTTTRKAATTDK
jgi:hypothetical protein